jgi:lysyl-tRNA synthetase class 1
MLRWIFASQRPGSEFQISFDLDVIKLYEDFDRARRLAHEAEDGGKGDKKRRIARRTFELSSLCGARIEPGSPVPFLAPFRGLSTLLQAFDGDVEAALSHYEAAGEITTDAERAHCRARAARCWRWIETFAPDDFRYRIRVEPVVRELSAHECTAIGRLARVLRDEPEISEEALVVHLRGACEGTDLDLKTLSPVLYDLLIDRDHGPKLTTLLTTMGGRRALPLLEASLEA